MGGGLREWSRLSSGCGRRRSGGLEAVKNRSAYAHPRKRNQGENGDGRWPVSRVGRHARPAKRGWCWQTAAAADESSTRYVDIATNNTKRTVPVVLESRLSLISDARQPCCRFLCHARKKIPLENIAISKTSPTRCDEKRFREMKNAPRIQRFGEQFCVFLARFYLSRPTVVFKQITLQCTI